MRKLILMYVMTVAGTLFAISATAEGVSKSVEFRLQEEKTQIKPDALPNPVKQAIAENETLKEFPVSEAWQIKSAEGTISFKVAFDNGTVDKLWKTYDPQGHEIKE